MREKLSERASGQWRDILPHFGISPKVLNGKHHPCPICGGKDRFRFDDKEGRGTWFCSHCRPGDGVTLVMKFQQCDFRTAAEKIESLIGKEAPKPPKPDKTDEQKRLDMRSLWKRSKPVSINDPAGKYLHKRCGIIEFPGCLRYVESLRYYGDQITEFPGLIALISDADGKPVSLHRTYLSPDGSDKAPLSNPRRLMPGTIPKGSAVRLAQFCDTLGVAEGIETALSASVMHGVPVWPCINTSLLSAWVPPPNIKRVLIYGDNDGGYAGQAAAYTLAYRLAAMKLDVEVRIPGHVVTQTDWNDEHAAQMLAG